MDQNQKNINSDQRDTNSDQHDINSGWASYAKLVLNELERHEGILDKLDQRIRDINEKALSSVNIEIATLKTKALIFGALSGTVFSAIMFAIMEFIFHHS